MFCEKCGKELKDGALFCRYCGAKVNIEGQSAGNAENPPVNVPYGEVKPQTKDGDGAKKKKGKGGIIAAIIIAIAVLAAGAGGILYFTSDSYHCRKNMKLAEKFFEEEEYEDALAYYEEALEIDSSLGEAYLNSAEICLIQGDSQEAVKILKKGLKKAGEEYEEELADMLEEAYREAIDYCLKEGDFDKVFVYCEDAGIDSKEYVQSFTDLKPEEIGGQFVFVNLTDNFGCFLEEYDRDTKTGTRTTTALYYVIWTGDEDTADWRYMTIKVPASYETQMDEMYDGDTTPVYFYGGIKELDEEEYSFFEDYFKESGWSDAEIEEGTLKYYIDACH